MKFFGFRKKIPFCLAIRRHGDRRWLPLVQAVGAVDLDSSGGDFRESAGEVVGQGVVERERGPGLNNNIPEVL